MMTYIKTKENTKIMTYTKTKTKTKMMTYTWALSDARLSTKLTLVSSSSTQRSTLCSTPGKDKDQGDIYGGRINDCDTVFVVIIVIAMEMMMMLVLMMLMVTIREEL